MEIIYHYFQGSTLSSGITSSSADTPTSQSTSSADISNTIYSTAERKTTRSGPSTVEGVVALYITIVTVGVLE